MLPNMESKNVINPSSKNEQPMEPSKKEEISLDQLQKELDKERQRANDYFRQLQYLQADFENYRRRVEKEIAEAKQMSNESLVRSLLNVVDELELALKAARESSDKEAILKGLEMVLKNLYLLLESQGLAKIEALGNKFDPNKHESAEVVINEKYEEGTIIEEIRKGFTFKGKVIRPSLVKVTAKPPAK
ncbi:MAG: nucleotide exchange factor GrpE [Nitrososphaerales archaeon]